MLAAFHDHPAVVRRLLRAGADTAARAENGKTANDGQTPAWGTVEEWRKRLSY